MGEGYSAFASLNNGSYAAPLPNTNWSNTSALMPNVTPDKYLDPNEAFSTNTPLNANAKIGLGDIADNTRFTNSLGDGIRTIETEPPGMFSKLLGDEHMMGNITGLASALMQAIALPAALKNAKLQNQALEHNIDTAKAEQARRNKNIASFNAHPMPITSAFA